MLCHHNRKSIKVNCNIIARINVPIAEGEIVGLQYNYFFQGLKANKDYEKGINIRINMGW